MTHPPSPGTTSVPLRITFFANGHNMGSPVGAIHELPLPGLTSDG
ncbi:hypothetical protein THTE_0920 [Thermogutta terrifontis]|uniref:Uncharacterized protein n=1 Tax=Thermogutta terrifontis TaxID=1331910 RepID=A0A286RC29_9BACT|nr:hypothetical protein THTE_0920 [Thermogutta terrifontis]